MGSSMKKKIHLKTMKIIIKILLEDGTGSIISVFCGSWFLFVFSLNKSVY